MSTPLEFTQARDCLLAHRDDYAAAVRDFRWPRLTTFNWALDHFDVQAKDNHTLALWVVDEDGREEKISHRDMAARSNRMANFLREHGVRRGDRMLIMLPNCVALWEIMLGAIKLGAVIIPATTLLTSGDIADRIERGRVRHVVVTGSETAKFASLPGGYTRFAVGPAAAGWIDVAEAAGASAQFRADGDTPANDPLLLYFTSGTTSKPKLVLHTQQSYPVGHLTTMYWIGLRPGDVHWNISSPGWAKHAWSSLFAPWNAGATVFVYNYARFDAKAVLDTIVRCGVTTLCAPPTVWRMLIQEDLAKYRVALRELTSAGEPLNPEVIDRVREAWGLTIRDGYGQTETTCIVGNSPGQPLKPGSMGRPMPGYGVTLLDPEGAPADEGEIALVLEPRPVGLMTGYADDPAKTTAVTQGERYRTGDVASRDADGYITYVGRADDVFKASDYRISPFELESVLIEHEAVAEAAVVPSPDPLRLAVPKCFVALRAGHAPSRELALSILKHARDRLAPYKRIRRLEFADLPKTISGKIRRVDLRNAEAARTGERGAAEFWEEDLPELR
ncbi:MAG: AMP-binding protein [Burkholderiales bacterium]|nr:AMP-binding protein [Burkholderiales bacterium]